MTNSAPSSVSRYRPAVLTLLGASAAYAAWLVYTSVTSPSPSGLHRSNAVRRGTPRTNRPTGPARITRLLQHRSIPLGDVDLFGQTVSIDAREIITPELLAQVADSTTSQEQINRRLVELYDDVVVRLLARAGRPLTTTETDIVIVQIAEAMPHDMLIQALGRYREAMFDSAAALADGAESVVPTEVSWPSDEGTEGGIVDADGQTLQRTLYHIAEDRARYVVLPEHGSFNGLAQVAGTFHCTLTDFCIA